MTQEEARTLLPVIKSYAEGKQVQYRTRPDQSWSNASAPVFDSASDGVAWRAKPEPPEVWIVTSIDGGETIATNYCATHEAAERAATRLSLRPSALVAIEHMREVEEDI